MRIRSCDKLVALAERSNLLRDWVSLAMKIAVIDDDDIARESMCALLVSAGYTGVGYDTAVNFLKHFDPTVACVISDFRMPEMDGLELRTHLAHRHIDLPVILITGFGDIPLAVQAIHAGAADFIEKPVKAEIMLDAIERALDAHKQSSRCLELARQAREFLALLTPREHTVLQHLIDGQSSKVAAHQLAISPRTLENHRASIMHKLHARNMADIMRIALAAE